MPTLQAGVWSAERRLLTVGLVSLITAVAFEGLGVPTILPPMVAELGDLHLYGWAFSAYWLTNIVGITLAGTDADRRGPGRAFIVGVGLFSLGMVVAGVAGSMPVVIAGRAVQGLGSGAMGAIVYVVIARAYSAQAMPRMIALLSSAWVVPGLVGPALAGLIAEYLSWRWVFLGLVPIALLIGAAVAAPIVRLGPPPLREAGPTGRSRVRDAVLLAAGSTVLLSALTAGGPLVAVPLAALGLLLAVPPLRRLLPPGSLLARPGPPAVVTLMFLISFAFFGTEAFVPLAVVDVRGATPTVGGLALTAAALTWTTGSWLADRLAPRGFRRPLVGGGAALVAAGIAVVALVLLPDLPIPIAAVGWAIGGLGMGLAYSTLSLLVLESAEPGGEGRASAALQLMFTLGTALGAGAGGALVALAATNELPLALGIGLVNAAMLLAALIGALLASRVPGTPPVRRESAREPVLASPAGVAGHFEESGGKASG